MRKKEALRQNSLLTSRLLDSDCVIADYRQQVERLKDENEQLKKRLKESEAQAKRISREESGEPCAASTETTTDAKPCVETVESAGIGSSGDAVSSTEPTTNPPVPDAPLSHFEFLEKEPIGKEALEPEEYAVKVLSDLILESTRITCILSSGHEPNQEERINRALGRTESAKAEIFRVLSLGLSDDEAIFHISEEFEKVTTYFQSLIQKTT